MYASCYHRCLPALALAMLSLWGGGCKDRPPDEAPAGDEFDNVPPEAQPFQCVAFSPAGKLLAAGRGTYHSGRGTYVEAWAKVREYVAVWPTDTWANPRVYQNNLSSSVEGVAFTADGRELIAASDAYEPPAKGGKHWHWDGKRIYSWLVDTGKPKDTIALKDFPGAGFVERMAYAPKADLVGLAISGGEPLVINRKAGKPKYVPEGHNERNSTCLAFSPDEKTLASCVRLFDYDKPPRRPLRLYAADTGKLLAQSDAGGAEPRRAAFSPKGDRLAVACQGGEVLSVAADLSKIEATGRITVAGWVSGVAYSPNGDTVAVATKYAVYLLDAKDMKVIRRLGDKLATVGGIAFSPDGKLLAAAYGTTYSILKEKPAGGVLVWEVATGKLIKELK